MVGQSIASIYIQPRQYIYVPWSHAPWLICMSPQVVYIGYTPPYRMHYKHYMHTTTPLPLAQHMRGPNSVRPYTSGQE